jgi:hypothetical protein
VPAVPIPAALPLGNMDQKGPHGAALTQALAALFTAGALTDLTPFLPAAGCRGGAKSQGWGYQRRAGNIREHAGQPDGTADARRGGSRPFRAGPRRDGQLRRSGKPGPFGNLTG